jgi:hypothetical protein
VQKGKKYVTFALISAYGTTMVLHKEGVYRDGTIDEKVTVISSIVMYIRIVHTKPRWRLRWDQCYFFVTEAGNALAALGNIHKGDSHILK